jgi:hypothetical protein
MKKNLPAADLRKESSPINDWRIVFHQCMIPMSMVINEMSKVDLLFTIGRILLLPAFVITALLVTASSPLIGAWARSQATLDIEDPLAKKIQPLETPTAESKEERTKITRLK